MLFNSAEFIFMFLPVTLAGFYLLRRVSGGRWIYAWLMLASLFYYGYWNPSYLWLILFSIGFNFWIGRRLGHSFEKEKKKTGKGTLAFGVGANLALLGWFKYTYFIAGNLGALLNVSWSLPVIILPLGISFFTFQQIAYLIDAYEGKTHEYNLFHYGLFVTFFPQLIAGPIVHHREILSQFDHEANRRISPDLLAEGLSLFSAGMFKKVVIADQLARMASPYFDLLGEGAPLAFGASWAVILAYTFQIYFDFSGYSDMAIGLGRLFGIRLPENFSSPYKAASITDFWRRWHITLSRFLRDYLYIPLGGNRHGISRRYANLLITMLLGGLWHGAAWLFVIWGGLHGLFLCVNHGWQALMQKLHDPAFTKTVAWKALCAALTFFSVVVAWVFFRSSDLDAALLLLKGMSGQTGFSALPKALEDAPVWIAFSAGIAWLLPNTAEFIFGRSGVWGKYLQWKPAWIWSILFSFLFLTAIVNMNRASEFIYYQF